MDDWTEEELEPQWTSNIDDSEWKELFSVRPSTQVERLEMDWCKEIIYCMKTNQIDLMRKRLQMLSREQLQLFFTLFPTEDEVLEMDEIQETLAIEEENEMDL